MLPKGELTRDQLSQLLLVYIGTAADIIEFFDSFKVRDMWYIANEIKSYFLGFLFRFVLTLRMFRKEKSLRSLSSSILLLQFGPGL